MNSTTPQPSQGGQQVQSFSIAADTLSLMLVIATSAVGGVLIALIGGLH